MLVGVYFPSAECTFHGFSCSSFLNFRWQTVPYLNAVGDGGYVLESFESEISSFEKFLSFVAFFIECSYRRG